jgi:hypothetical protein
MKTQIIADDLVIHIDTLQAAPPLAACALRLAKAHQLRYITFIPANGDRPFNASVRRLARMAQQAQDSA